MRGPNLGLRTILFLFSALALMIIDSHSNFFKAPRVFLTDITSPLQRVVNWPVDVIDWISSSVASRQKLMHENASLRTEQVLLNARLEKFIALQKENNQLRALLESSPKIDTNKMLVAQVLAVDSASFLKQIVLDKGRQQGVFIGQAVIDATGVVGQVVSVSRYTSRVMLLSDVMSSIPVENSRNNLRGIINGSGAYENLRLVHMPATADVQVGDKLVSSGLGLRYPVGYPVGTVTNVSHDSSEPFLNVAVTPAAAINSTRLVLLVWPTQQKVVQSAKKDLHAIKKLVKQRNKNRQQSA